MSIEKRSGKLADRLLRCRYELKYRISESKAAAIEQFIKPYLHVDHYCKLQPSGAYPVVTLYLDSHNLGLCRQTLEGNKNRFKLRIRSYTDEPDYPRFFEIKRRMNVIIIKSRARVMYPDIATLLSGMSLPPQDYETDEETLKQFQLYMKSINAEPVMQVRYVRRAYEGDSENRVRVTFDRQLAYNVGSEPEVRFGGRGWQRHSLEGVILEIKFTARYPAWLSRMVRYFDLQQRSISKYVTSVKQSCLVGYCAPRTSV
ncbi:MAG: VTC domain-containing protein [Planctomycetota bacterium]